MLHQLQLVLTLILGFAPLRSAFLHPIVAWDIRCVIGRPSTLFLKEPTDSEAPTSSNNSSISYDETDASSKGLVSSLTGLVNFFSFKNNDPETINNDDKTTRAVSHGSPPATPEELLERIRDDYVVRNYLWTGKIDLTVFDQQCKFTDPTLSFEGTNQFTENLKNLVPIVDALTEPGGCQSILLDIQLYRDKGYVQSRWNMLGSLTGLPWKPKIDVIGRTKFWYKPVEIASKSQSGFQVYSYDEEWEIPAGKALLQLITPPGTIRNTKD